MSWQTGPNRACSPWRMLMFSPGQRPTVPQPSVAYLAKSRAALSAVCQRPRSSARVGQIAQMHCHCQIEHLDRVNRALARGAACVFSLCTITTIDKIKSRTYSPPLLRPAAPSPPLSPQTLYNATVHTLAPPSQFAISFPKLSLKVRSDCSAASAAARIRCVHSSCQRR